MATAPRADAGCHADGGARARALRPSSVTTAPRYARAAAGRPGPPAACARLWTCSTSTPTRAPDRAAPVPWDDVAARASATATALVLGQPATGAPCRLRAAVVRRRMTSAHAAVVLSTRPTRSARSAAAAAGRRHDRSSSSRPTSAGRRTSGPCSSALETPSCFRPPAGSARGGSTAALAAAGPVPEPTAADARGVEHAPDGPLDDLLADVAADAGAHDRPVVWSERVRQLRDRHAAERARSSPSWSAPKAGALTRSPTSCSAWPRRPATTSRCWCSPHDVEADDRRGPRRTRARALPAGRSRARRTWYPVVGRRPARPLTVGSARGLAAAYVAVLDDDDLVLGALGAGLPRPATPGAPGQIVRAVCGRAGRRARGGSAGATAPRPGPTARWDTRVLPAVAPRRQPLAGAQLRLPARGVPRARPALRRVAAGARGLGPARPRRRPSSACTTPARSPRSTGAGRRRRRRSPRCPRTAGRTRRGGSPRQWDARPLLLPAGSAVRLRREGIDTLRRRPLRDRVRGRLGRSRDRWSPRLMRTPAYPPLRWVVPAARPAAGPGVVTARATVVVVTWQGRAPARRRAWTRWRRRPSARTTFDVVVVDNASTDGTADAARRPAGVTGGDRAARNLGFAGGATLGLRTVTTPYAVVLNNDATPDADWLERLLGGLRARASRPSRPRSLLEPRYALVAARRCGATQTVRGGDWSTGSTSPATVVARRTADGLELAVPVARRRRRPRCAVHGAAGSARTTTVGRPTPSGSTSSTAPAALLTPTGHGADRGYLEVDRGQYDDALDVFAVCGAAPPSAPTSAGGRRLVRPVAVRVLRGPRPQLAAAARRLGVRYVPAAGSGTGTQPPVGSARTCSSSTTAATGWPC